MKELKQKQAACTRQLEKEQSLLKQMEARKSIFAAQFNELTKQPTNKGPNWLSMLLWKIQSIRLNKIQEKIERIEMQIKKQLEMTINPLVDKIGELEEEEKYEDGIGNEAINPFVERNRQKRPLPPYETLPNSRARNLGREAWE